MAFGVEEFPFTSEYDSDLRAVLKYIREIKKLVGTYDDIIEELKQELENIQDLYPRVDALERATADLSTIRQNVNSLFRAVDNLSNEDVVLQNQINSLREQLNGINTQFNDVYKYIDTSIASVNARWYGKWLQLQNLINERYHELDTMFKNLEDMFAYVLEHLSSDVYNPVSNTRITFDDNNRRVYVDLRDSGMSYGELSERQLTYGFVRDAHWRHRLFSTKGRRYVTHSDQNLFSPISGRWTNWSEALSHAIGSIFKTITYGQLAVQAITYEQLSSMSYAELIRVSDRDPLDYEELSQLTINGNNLLSL